jgi:hypothetical protein
MCFGPQAAAIKATAIVSQAPNVRALFTPAKR